MGDNSSSSSRARIPGGVFVLTPSGKLGMTTGTEILKGAVAGWIAVIELFGPCPVWYEAATLTELTPHRAADYLLDKLGRTGRD